MIQRTTNFSTFAVTPDGLFYGVLAESIADYSVSSFDRFTFNLVSNVTLPLMDVTMSS
jgi:hypothetical protein